VNGDVPMGVDLAHEAVSIPAERWQRWREIAREIGNEALSSSTAMAFANLCWSPVVHCTGMRAAVAAQYKFRLVGTALALHSALARAQPPRRRIETAGRDISEKRWKEGRS
jgi:hypothetical protein